MFKRFFCDHVYSPIKLIRSDRRDNDNLVISLTFYKCLKCNKSFTVQDDVKVEKDYYLAPATLEFKE